MSFEKTGFAQKLFNVDIPKIVSALERIATALERQPHNSVFVLYGEDGVEGVYSTHREALSRSSSGDLIIEHEVQ